MKMNSEFWFVFAVVFFVLVLVTSVLHSFGVPPWVTVLGQISIVAITLVLWVGNNGT
jgi:hypothetical protein